MTRQPAISFSISFHFPFNRAGGRTSNVRQRIMPWTDCKLNLAITNESGINILKFSQPPWGSNLTTVRLPESHDAISTNFHTRPSWFAKSILWIVCGVKDYVPILAVESPTKPHTFARFYRCKDRRGRQRTFAEVGEPNSDSGATFIVKEEDFCVIQKQLLQLQHNKTGEQD